MSRRSSGSGRQQPSSHSRAARPRPGAAAPRPTPGAGASAGAASRNPDRAASPRGARPSAGGRLSGGAVRRQARQDARAGTDESYRADVYSGVKLRSPDGPLRARPDPLKNLPTVRRDDRTAMGLPARGRVSRFFADLGWRAYAIPVLAVATCLALLDVASGGDAPDSRPAGSSQADGGAPPSPKQSIWVDAPTDPKAKPPGGALPAGPPYTQAGSGEFEIVPDTSQIYGTNTESVKRFTVEIESGVTGIRGDEFAQEVERILSDPRGWTHDGSVSFQRVDSGIPDFRVSLATPATLRPMCGYSLQLETSCYNRDEGRVIINLSRWVRGAVAYGIDLAAYRQYAVTHEVGHAIGHGHEACPKKNALAPPMLQQTLGLTSSNGLTCKPNPWPFPEGDKEVTGPATDDPPK